MIETTSAPASGTTERPSLRGRRLLARLVDGVLALVLSAVICWPLVWGSFTEALAVGGFGSVGDLASDWLEGTPGGDVGRVVEEVRPVVLGTVLLQALVVWAYEALATTVTGSTPGKALARLRVVLTDRGNAFTLGPTEVGATRSWWERPLRMGLRAAVVVGPPAVAAGTLVAGLAGIPGATELAEITIAVSIALLLLWVAFDSGAHGALTRTDTVSFSWQEARERAQAQARSAAGAVQERGGSAMQRGREGVEDAAERSQDRVNDEVTRQSRDRLSSARLPGQVGAPARTAWEQLQDTPLGPVLRSIREALERSRVG